MSFSTKIIDWYQKNARTLPWRNTFDPYVIWLSEIILQQTRVEQGRPFFEAFVTNFPDIKSFADADEENILRLWQGLGYYSRARNMHKAAKAVVEKFNGQFPTSYEELIKLPGVGDYTASAISSFSSNEHRAVLDGNVFRVLSRYFGIDTPINSSEGKKVFKEIAQELIPEDYAGIYNQAIMDFGALQCKPKAPLCESCILRLACVAYREDRISQMPVKTKAKASRNRYFHYFIYEEDSKILMSKRGMGDVWANLYEFPLIETEHDVDIQDITSNSSFLDYFEGATVMPINGPIKHVLSHQNIFARFYRITDLPSLKTKKEGWDYFLSENLDSLAKHKLIFSFINSFMS